MLGHAEAEIIYAVYRPRRGLAMVPRRDLADPAVQRILEHEETFYFRRQTRFEVISDHGEAVRLRHFSPSAIDNWWGIAFESSDAARRYADEEYGVSAQGWQAAPN